MLERPRSPFVHHAIHLIRCQDVREAVAKRDAREITEMAGVCGTGAQVEPVPATELGRTAAQQRAHDRMAVGIVALAQLLQRSVKDVPERYSLADVDVAERVDMDPTWGPEILVRALLVAFPQGPRDTVG